MGYENTKRILVVSPFPISYPPRDGHSLNVIYRSYFLKVFANVNSDIIVSENSDYSARDLINSGIFDNVFTYYTKSKWKSLVKSLFSQMTHLMIRYDMSNVELKRIIDVISENKYQAVIFDHSCSYPLYNKLMNHIKVDGEKQSKIIYWSHNIDYIDSKVIGSESDNPLKKLIHYITSKKLEKIEPEYIRKFSKIISVSSHEVNILRKINPAAKIWWIPPILPEPKKDEFVDEKFISEISGKVKDYKYKILFVGLLNKPSNILPCIWFANYVLPIIKNNLDGKLCFLIVGKDPSKEIFNLAENNKDILVFPNVSSVLPFYKLADLVVIPIFNPSGIKLKLIEALKYRKKVVARPETLLGAGLENIVPSATDPQDFAKKCIQAIQGKIDYEPIWNKFEQIYDNKKIVDKLMGIIELA